MPKKLHVVERDILSLLQKMEPSMLLWREIKASLWPLHKTRYKDEKVFGVAISNYLTRNEDKLWKHHGDYWGTPKSSPPGKQAESKYSGVLILLSLAGVFAFGTWGILRVVQPTSPYVPVASNSTNILLGKWVIVNVIPWVFGVFAITFCVLAIAEFKRVCKLARMLLAYF